MAQEIYELGQFIPLHYHYQMLTDSSRMNAFRTAIEQGITSEYRVAELGCGTGVMSFFAARQGARVWSVERNPTLVAASRKFISANGMADRVKVYEADASTWLPPEPVDVVICEMLHSALLREKQVQVIAAFRGAHQAQFGFAPQFLPGATLLAVQPVRQCYDFSGFHAPVPLFQPPYDRLGDCEPCSEPAVYEIVDYDHASVGLLAADVLFPFQEDTEINALRFITKNVLAMDLATGITIDWHSQHLVLPLPQPYVLSAGQALRVCFDYLPGDSIEKLTEAIQAEVI
ncbi:MAG: methyltransferase domain-containing protein [Negativicutes bacterium]|nr:methyltransferase domain-containing protein [Negativicutes bacterium]